MHILVLTQNNIVKPTYGGALRVSFLIDHLLKQGDSVSVIRFRSVGDAPSPIDTNTPIYDVVVPAGYALAPLAVLTHFVSRAAERIAREINRIRAIDLVQSDPPWSALTGSRIARRLGVPHVLLAQNCESVLAAQFSETGPARKLPLIGGLVADFNVAVVRWAERQAVHSAKLTLTPSVQDRAELASVGIETQQVEVLPNGTSVKRVPTEIRDQLRSSLGLGPATPTVIFLGRLDYPTNFDAANAICSQIAPSCPNIMFMLVGSNPPQMNTPENVMLIGQVDQVAPYLSAADLSVAPLTRGSGTRIKILDAWAAGVPVLATSVGASGLSYTNGVDIVIEDRIERFSDRIQELLDNPVRLTNIARAATTAVSPYRWETVGQSYSDSLHALLKRP